jgi:predicted SAM-dependent methyltransferase
MNTLKLHLGCGPKYIKGWHHVDALKFDHVDTVGPVDKLPFGDGEAEIIYASHVLEHFGRHKCIEVLTEWYRVLRPGGILRLAVPNFEVACALYLNSNAINKLELIKGLVCGGQKDEYDFHGNIFDFDSLKNLLVEAGFKKVQLWDWRETEHTHIDDYSQAYLPHMQKETGALVSLNVEGHK